MEPYPTTPVEPGQPYRPPGQGPAPASVRTAIMLIWVGIAIGLVALAVSFFMLDELVDYLLDGDDSLDRDTARTILIVTLVISAVFAVGIELLFVFFLQKGANWARIVYVVFAGLGIVLSLVDIARDQPAVLVIGTVITTVLNALTIYLLFRRDANAFYRAPKMPD